MVMNAALSGLKAAQTDIDATAHNISNVGTTGFRASSVHFADVFSTSPEGIGRLAVGSGTEVTRISQDFTDGSIEATGKPLDLAVSGSGFFAVRVPADVAGSGGQTLYTRAGDFSLDAGGTLVNTAGNQVLGWPVSADGQPLSQSAAAAGAITVPFTMGSVAPSTGIDMKVSLPTDTTATGGQTAVPPAAAFDAADSSTWAFRSSVPLVNADGTAAEGEVYFTKLTTPTEAAPETQWQVQLVKDGTVMNTAANTLTFGADGTTGTTMPLAFTTTAGDALTLDLSGTTLADSAFSVASASADGSTPAKMSGIEVDATGTIWASYGTGEPVAQGQLMLANFVNTGGLMQTGNSSFAATTESGQPAVGSALSAGFGKMTSGGLESSNVDLTVELVDLITAQRNYQASAKALETDSALMKTIMNLSS